MRSPNPAKAPTGSPYSAGETALARSFWVKHSSLIFLPFSFSKLYSSTVGTAMVPAPFCHDTTMFPPIFQPWPAAIGA